MLKAHRRTLMITSLITLLPILAGVILWNRLPEVMATHFNMKNEADGFCSKTVAVFGIPLFLLALLWVGALVTSRDPKRENISPKIFRLVLWTVPVISLIAALFIYSYNLGLKMDNGRFLSGVFGMMFLVLGNFLPKARRNHTIGIRIPWTLASEENWNRTHRLAGFLWVGGGLLLLVLAILGYTPKWVLGFLILLALVPCIYSFYLSQKGV